MIDDIKLFLPTVANTHVVYGSQFFERLLGFFFNSALVLTAAWLLRFGVLGTGSEWIMHLYTKTSIFFFIFFSNALTAFFRVGSDHNKNLL